MLSMIMHTQRNTLRRGIVRTRRRLLIRWAGADLEPVLQELGLQVEGSVVELASARIEVDRAALPPGRPRLRIDELTGDHGRRAQPPRTLDLAAVGWATVELDRAARELGGDWLDAPEDSLLGASTRRRAGARPALLLLEPNTEGRLAGALAHYGEGPIALYLELPDPKGVAECLRARPGIGPLGSQWLVIGRDPAGPFLILVGERATPGNATAGNANRVPSQP